MNLTEQQLSNINGGGYSAAYMNAIIRGATFIYELGRSLGSTFRQYKSKAHC